MKHEDAIEIMTKAFMDSYVRLPSYRKAMEDAIAAVEQEDFRLVKLEKKDPPPFDFDEE